MAITAAQVKELRERTGAPMMDCKKALSEVSGDMEKAVDEIKKRGLAKAEKKSARVTAEGAIIALTSADNKRGLLIEINCETDFVARDENFVSFANHVAKLALESNITDIKVLNGTTYSADNAQTVDEVRQAVVAKIGENMQVRRIAILESTGSIGAYVHGGRIGALVDLDGGSEALARNIAMQVAACHPNGLGPDDVPEELVEREKAIFVEQARESGKPENIIEKMITGRIQKFLKENCLLGQDYIRDPNQTIEQLLKAENATATSFVRFELGDGIEKETVDFAEEVMSQARGG